MAVHDRILAAIEAVYDAAIDETRWTDALTMLAHATGSQAASFWVLDGSAQPRLPVFDYINFDPAFIDEYLDHMVSLDPTVEYLVAHPGAPIVHDGLFITEREKDRHPYYDWHHRYSDTRFRLVNRISPAPDVQAGIALHRTRKAERYQPADIGRFSVLHRHIERALRIGFQLGTLGTMQSCTTGLLDRSRAAIVLLDEKKRIVYANRSAEALRAAGDGFSMSARCVALSRAQDNSRLQCLIDGALRYAEVTTPADGAMQASRPSGRRPYTILVSPLSRCDSGLSALRPAVCIVIVDPEEPASLSTDRLRAVFHLTQAEARLAVRLAEGEDLRAAASRLGIGYGTARARLAEIFRKTNTHRQGELIRLLLTAAGL